MEFSRNVLRKLSRRIRLLAGEKFDKCGPIGKFLFIGECDPTRVQNPGWRERGDEAGWLVVGLRAFGGIKGIAMIILSRVISETATITGSLLGRWFSRFNGRISHSNAVAGSGF